MYNYFKPYYVKNEHNFTNKLNKTIDIINYLRKNYFVYVL